MDKQEVKTKIPFWAAKLAKRTITIYRFYDKAEPGTPGVNFSDWTYYYDKQIVISFKKELKVNINPYINEVIERWGKKEDIKDFLSFAGLSLRNKKWKLIKEPIKLDEKSFNIRDNTFLAKYMIYAVFEGY